MGQKFCSCSAQSLIWGYDDLPDRIPQHSAMHKNSIISFKSHKIVTTISLSPVINKHYHHHKHHHHHIDRLSITINQDLSLLPPIAMDTINENYDDLHINKTYVLYREGFCEGDDGELQSINTITTRTLIKLDIDGISNILSNKLHLNHIISRCPEKLHFMKWKCLYSLLNDGCSINTFYHNTKDMEQSILIIKDGSNNVFGAYLDSKWNAEYHHYSGSNECFVYKFHFETNEYSIFEYHPHGEKPYFMNCDYDGITIGAGECPAIYINNDLLLGRTTKSDTFKNDPLSSNSIFNIKDIEIWCPFFE